MVDKNYGMNYLVHLVLKVLQLEQQGTQCGGWFNKEINQLKILKGLKMRIPGLGGTVMSKLGALQCFFTWWTNL